MVGSVGMVWGVAEEGMSKEDRKEEKKRKQEAKKHERELRREEKRKERQARREERRRERGEHKKEVKQTKSKEGKCLAKEERKEKNKAKEQASKEKHERRRLDREAKHQQYKERCRARREQRSKAYDQSLEKAQAKRHAKDDGVRKFRGNREVLIDKWAHSHQAAVDHARGEGKYAFLYKSTAWPIYTQNFEGGKHLFNVNFKYQYACDSYNSTGGGSKSNITKLAFGEDPITWDSILLAKKLYDTVPFNSVVVDNNHGMEYLMPQGQNPAILFRGKEESYHLDFELSRYIVSNVIAVGVDIPVLYKKHKLNTVFNFATPTPDFRDSDLADVNAPAMFKKVLLAKGISELGGSAMGLGDVSAFINAQINSVAFDKLVVGVRGQFATGKKATARKLWAPELGNGGWTEFGLFGSCLVSHAKYLNPHLMLEASFSLPAHLERRLPRWVEFEDAAGNVIVNEHLTSRNLETIAFGDRILTVADAAVAAYDTTTKGFGDHAVKARITKGAEFKLRFGNMFERFILTKGFLDLFYDFRGKQKDTVNGVDTEQYNTSVLRDHTQELEHRIGFEYSYQFDLKTRLRLGSRYTFAGMNVPKTFEVSGAMNYAF
jgi:hypothetical protein